MVQNGRTVGKHQLLSVCLISILWNHQLERQPEENTALVEAASHLPEREFVFV